MTCVLANNISKGCRESKGGVKRILVTELSNKGTLVSASGIITAFPLTTGKKFWTWEFEKETAEPTEKEITDPTAGTQYYEGELKIQFNKRETVKSQELKTAAKTPLMVIIHDNNDEYWLAGEANGCDIPSRETKFGKALGDHSGYLMTITWREPDEMKQVQSSLIAGLLVAAS